MRDFCMARNAHSHFPAGCYMLCDQHAYVITEVNLI